MSIEWIKTEWTYPHPGGFCYSASLAEGTIIITITKAPGAPWRFSLDGTSFVFLCGMNRTELGAKRRALARTKSLCLAAIAEIEEQEETK